MAASASNAIRFIVPPLLSHHCAQVPRDEFVRSEAVPFALAGLARGGGEHQLEDLAPRLRDRERSIQDLAAIDVHVVLHPLVHRGVGGDLDRRRGLAAVYRAAPGSKADEVGSAGDLPGSRYRVVAR